MLMKAVSVGTPLPAGGGGGGTESGKREEPARRPLGSDRNPVKHRRGCETRSIASAECPISSCARPRRSAALQDLSKALDRFG